VQGPVWDLAARNAIILQRIPAAFRIELTFVTRAA
jgi:hypothetical protein